MAENVKYTISLDDKFSSSMKKADRSVDNFDSKIEKTNKNTAGFAKKLGVMAAGAFALKKGFDIVSRNFKLGAQMEQTEIAFATFLGSAEKGRKVIDQLNQFANVTPFDNEEIIKSGRVLLSANIPAEKLTGTLQSIGDVAAGANVPINELANIYSKAMNKGKLQAEELNQLAERGIPIIDVLSKEFGVTKQEVFELGSKGKITSDVMTKAFKTMTSEGGIFFNLMSKQSESASGLTSTFQGKMKLAATEMGKRLLPAAKKVTKGLINFADKMIDIAEVPLSEELNKTRFALNAELEVLKRGDLTLENRRKLVGKINQEYGDYLPNLLDEKSTLEDIEAAQKAANKELFKRIEIEAKRELIQEAIEKAARAERKLLEFQINSEKLLANQRQAAQKSRLGVQKAVINKITDFDEKSFARRQERRKQEVEFLKSEAARLQKLFGDVALDDFFPQDELEKRISATAIPGKELKEGITTIKSAAPKTFNINIQKLVENFTVQSETIEASAGETRDFFVEQLILMLADAQAIAG